MADNGSIADENDALCTVVGGRVRMKLDLETSGWPPKEGAMVYFETGSGVKKGRFARIHRGLVWMEYGWTTAE